MVLGIAFPCRQCSILEDFVSFWVIRVLFWEFENWKHGLNWIRLDQIGSKWIKLLQTGSNWSWHGIDNGLEKHGLDKHGHVKHGIDKHGLDTHGLDTHGLDKHGLDKHDLQKYGLDMVLIYFEAIYLWSWIDFQSCFYKESLKCDFYFVAIWMSRKYLMILQKVF